MTEGPTVVRGNESATLIDSEATPFEPPVSVSDGGGVGDDVGRASRVSTLMRPTPAPTQVVSAAAIPTTAVTGSPRSTVLPRIEVEGDGARLVLDGRARFESVSVLGRGGFGEVTLARDNDIQRRVALKRLLPEASGAAALVRFVDEVRTVGQLDHPNIVPLHDVGLDADGRYYYVMKYVDGETLEAVIAGLAAGDAEVHRRYAFEKRTEVFLGILRAVQYAHAQGIIHRDLKPANVMVGRYGEVVVMDWGIARRLHDVAEPQPDTAASAPPAEAGGAEATASGVAGGREAFRTRRGALIGTPAYMSPEQARGEHAIVDERSDIYSLCVLFHEFLTLRHYLADRATLEATLEGVMSLAPPVAASVVTPVQGGAPAELSHYLKRGLSKDRSARFRSVTAMIDQLQDIREGRIAVECPITLMKRSGWELFRVMDRHPGRMMVGLMVVLALLAGSVAVMLAALVRVT